MKKNIDIKLFIKQFKEKIFELILLVKICLRTMNDQQFYLEKNEKS